MTRTANKRLTTVLLTLTMLTSLSVTSLASDCDDSHTHSYSAESIEPTCEENGYTVFTCDSCGDSYREKTSDNVAHDYSAWTGNENSENSSRHRSVCRYCGRTTGESQDCDTISFAFERGTHHACLVCGTLDGEAMERVDDAVCKMGRTVISDEAIAVFEQEKPFGSSYVLLNEDYLDYGVIVNHAFTVTMVKNGAMKDMDSEIRVTVDYNAGSRRNFTLVRVNEDGKYEEIEYTYSNRKLSFKTDEAGMFLIFNK